jgi:hypothetical protein
VEARSLVGARSDWRLSNPAVPMIGAVLLSFLSPVYSRIKEAVRVAEELK